MIFQKDGKEQPGYYSILTADVRYCADLSDFAKVLCSDISALCNKQGYCSATNRYFAEQFGKSKRTISATIGALEERGFICCELIRDTQGEVVERRIRIANFAGENFHRGIEENFYTPMEENCTRCGEKTPDPMEKNCYKNNTSNNTITPNTPKEDGRTGKELFEAFWQAYPKKASKAQAEKAFAKLKPNDDLLHEMLSALEWQKVTVDWTKSKGQFIPYAATWLNNRRWEDEPESEAHARMVPKKGGFDEWD